MPSSTNLPADSANSAAGSFRISLDQADTDAPVDNLVVSYARGAGKTKMFDPNPAGVILSNAPMINNRPFLLLGGHLRGTVASFSGNYTLAADLVH